MTHGKKYQEKLPCPTPGCPNMRSRRHFGVWSALCVVCSRRAIATQSWAARAGHEAQRARWQAEQSRPISLQ